MTDFISSKSPESSLPPQQQQTLCRQTKGTRIQVPSTSSSTQSSTHPNRTSAHPVAPSLKYLQQFNHSIRAESDLVLSPPTSIASLPSQSFSSSTTLSPFTPGPTGPAIGGRVSAAITSLYQASVSSSESSSVPRSNSSSHIVRVNGAAGSDQSSRLQLPSVFTSNHIQGSRADQGFTEDTLSSLSTLMSQPQPQHQHQQQKLQKQTTPLVETTWTIPSPLPPQSMTLATTAPLDSAAPSPCFSSLSSSFLTPPPPPSPSLSSALPSSSPVPVPSSPTILSLSIITPEKISFTPFVSTTTKKEDEQQKELLDDKKNEEEAEKEADLQGNGNIKGENEGKEFSNNNNNTNTTTAMSTKTTTTTTTTTITSSCDSTSTSASMPAAAATTVTNAGQPAHTACVIPPVGRDNLRYGSLDAAAMNDEGTLLSMALIDTNTNKLRPMSSMEYAEPWLLTTAPSDIDSPMTGTAANSRRPSADTGLEQTYASAFHHHNNSIFGPLTMVTDQDTAAAAAATVSNAITNGPRRSSDQESVHPLQFDPEPRLSFDNNARTTSPSSSSSLPPLFSSLSSTGESWLSLATPSSSSSNNTSSYLSDFAQSTSALTTQTQEGVVPHKTIRKKTSLASKIRKVFIKPMSGGSTSNNGSSSNGSSNGSFSSKDQDAVDIHHGSSMQALEDMSSREGEIDTQGGLLRNGHRVGVAIGATAGELCLPPPASHLTEHRGSVSSSSSGESVSVGQEREGGGLSPCTPSTSPEVSPSGSPKPKHALAPLIIGPSTTVAGNGIQDGHPLSPVDINSNQLTLSPKPLEKRMSLEPTPSRTSKKRLSFASITSFFNARNTEAMAASNKKKQQRSSSVPNVESPLTGAGRQQQGSAAFQRRHSLNDLETGPQLQAKFAAPPWDKDRISAQAAAAAAEVLAHKVTENETSSGATTMSKIQGVFGKQSKKNKIKKGVSNSEKAPIAVAISSAKPLRSALAHRPVRAPSVRKVQVVHRHQGSNPNSGRRLHQVEPPLVNLLQEPTASNSTNDSRRNSEEHGGRTGPTRHRRQSSIAGRQASQQGHYPQMDRKQRVSVRYSSSEEYDILHHSDLYTLDQHQQQQQQLQLQQQQQQQQQFQYHGGYVQYDGSTAPQTPRVNPVSTKPLTPKSGDPTNYPLVNISPCTSRGAVAEGSFTFSPAGSRQRDSYISCSSHGSPSKDMSPQLASVSTPKQQQYQHNYAGSPASTVAAAIGNPHRRSSYDATSIHRRSSYEANSRRNSMVVTSSVSSPLSPPLTSTPVARLSVDHTLMSDHPGPSSSPSAYPQAIASVNGGHQHAIFANHQQQQQLQLQQQLHYQQQQQQFQLSQQHHHHQQMHYIPDHHQHHHHHQYQQQQQQQFMNPHAGSQIFHEQYHIQQKQQYPQQSPQSYQQYPPYPYQYNMQQPLPSHLYYTSVQHPALAYTGVNSSTMQPPLPPPPPLQYPTSKSSGSGSGGNPSPTSWSSVSPSPAPSTPPRRASRQLHFSTAQPQIHETWTPDQYDRTSDPNITAHKLTPAIAQRIKLELNTFKSQEMLVHQESRVNTHFFA